MNAPDPWPLPEETPDWWRDWPLTQEQMAEEYARQTAQESRDAEDRSVDAAGTYLGD